MDTTCPDIFDEHNNSRARLEFRKASVIKL